jgi:hypothetical protein
VMARNKEKQQAYNVQYRKEHKKEILSQQR